MAENGIDPQAAVDGSEYPRAVLEREDEYFRGSRQHMDYKVIREGAAMARWAWDALRSLRGSHLLALLAGIGLGWLMPDAYRKGRVAANAGAEAPRQVDLSVVAGARYKVRRVVDGDTIVLENGLHVRYLGVDTPERGRWVTELAPLAETARARNAALVEGRRVKLTLGPVPMDAYGRLLARVQVERMGASEGEHGAWVDVSAALIQEGLGRAMSLGLPRETYTALRARETFAKESKAGLWGLPHPLEHGNPKNYRYCASVHSGIFHPIDSSTARRIHAANFIGFKTLEEAWASGRALGKRYARQKER